MTGQAVKQNRAVVLLRSFRTCLMGVALRSVPGASRKVPRRLHVQFKCGHKGKEI